MRFDIVTIFPEIYSYLDQSIIGKAKKSLNIKVHDLRDFTNDKHRKVDDKPFGGERGMVMKIEPIYRAIKKIKKRNGKVILFTPRGKKFNQKMATEFSKSKQLVLLCGRYEGIDERVKHLVDEKVSIGNYVLMGGDIPALVVIEAVSRLLPGVVGKSQALAERITKKGGFIEYPQYTRPEEFKGWKVPKVLLSGNHKKIKEWRDKHSKIIE